MWWTINIALLAIGTFLLWKNLDSQMEDYGALLSLVGGGVMFIIGVVSSAVKAIWF